MQCLNNTGGDSKTLMFVQISPNENDVGETLCSLNFASRVRGIELGQAKKQVDVGELSRYKLMVLQHYVNICMCICAVNFEVYSNITRYWFCQVGRAKQDSKNKDAQIKSMEERIQTLEAKNKTKDLLTLYLQEKVYPDIFSC